MEPQKNILDKLTSFIKWAGSKRKILNILIQHMPTKYTRYVDPFVGGGSLLFNTLPINALISDSNYELINCYKVIKSQPNKLITKFNSHINTEEYYNYAKTLDINSFSDIDRAALFIYFNKTCFNGTYQVNKQNKFNASYGKYKSIFLDTFGIQRISNYLNDNNIEIHSTDFKITLDRCTKDDFVYLDPPYHNTHIRYSPKKFTDTDQIDLANSVIKLTNLGIKTMLSNSNTEFIRNLYKDFNIIDVDTSHSISIKSAGRKHTIAKEVLIKNFK